MQQQQPLFFETRTKTTIPFGCSEELKCVIIDYFQIEGSSRLISFMQAKHLFFFSIQLSYDYCHVKNSRKFQESLFCFLFCHYYPSLVEEEHKKNPTSEKFLALTSMVGELSSASERNRGGIRFNSYLYEGQFVTSFCLWADVVSERS